MEYVKIDKNNNIVKHSDSKIDKTYLEIGTDIKWKVDVKRNNKVITIFVDEMLEDSQEEVVRFYDNFLQLKVFEEKGQLTIRFKTEEEIQEEVNKKKAGEILTKLQPLMVAMSIQTNSLAKDANSQKAVFTDKQIKEIGEYVADIANGNLNVVMPELPEVYKNLIT